MARSFFSVVYYLRSTSCSVRLVNPIELYYIELLNFSCSILVCSHVLTLRMAEKLRSHVAELIGIVMATCSSLYKLGNTLLEIFYFIDS